MNVILVALLLSAPTTYYVSTTGNDANGCTVGAPCLTIQAGVNKAKAGGCIAGPTVVSVGAGHFPYGAYIDQPCFTAAGNAAPWSNTGPWLSIQGTMAQATLTGTMHGNVASATAGTGAWSEASSFGPSGPANWATVTVATAGWTGNALAGYEFCLTSGQGSPSCQEIYTNTATTLTLVGTWYISTPSPGDGFEIEKQATEIDGGIPRPQASMGLQSFSQFSAAFFVQGGGAPGWRSGFSSGFGNDVGFWPYTGNFNLQSVFGNASFSEPQISISNFRFDNADYLIDVGATGSNLVGFLNNHVETGIAARASGGASFLAVGNYAWQDSFGDNLFWLDDYASVAGYGNGNLYGNFVVLDAGYEESSSALSCGGTCFVAQNYIAGVLSSAGRGMQDGVVANGAGTIVSVGNEYKNLLIGLTDVNTATHYNIFTDADDFTGDAFAAYLNAESLLSAGTVQTAGNPPTSTGTAFGFVLADGAHARLNGTSIAGLGDGGDLLLNYFWHFPYAALLDGGGIWDTLQFDAGYRPSPGVLLDSNTGSAIYQ